MNKKELIKNSGILFLALALGACGSSGGGSTNSQNGDALKLNVSALSTKTVVAAAPKSKLDTMLAFLGSKEAVAAPAQGVCGAGNDGRAFDLKTAGFVCLEEALLVYEEIELETKNSAIKDEAESGPYLVDMIGTNADIPGSISLNVPNDSFNKIELKVGDLDDRSGDGSLDDSPSSSDDSPVNVSATVANNAGMANKSIKITGTADDGTGTGNTKPFTFFSNIEGKLEMPFDPTDPVVDGNTLVTFVDLSVGFAKLAFVDISASMDGNFAKAETCTAPKNPAQQLACDSVKNVELYHKSNSSSDDSFGSEKKHGGKGGFDDKGGKD